MPAYNQDIIELVSCAIECKSFWPLAKVIQDFFLGRFSWTDDLPVNYESILGVGGCLSGDSKAVCLEQC